MEPIVIGYRHTGIITSDINKSLHFYNKILGLEVIQDFVDSSEYINKITALDGATAHFIKLKASDGSVIELLEYPSHPTRPVNLSIINVGVCHIALRVHSAQMAYQTLIANDVVVLSEPVLSSEGIAKVFFCLDPDNVRIELVEML
jgi:catechol 2,3-dioxygenase-like lactoylglutathione lyase family enzyme